MEKENILILQYADNFADNLSTVAYGKILQDSTKVKCFFENNINKKLLFEEKMSCFNIDYSYISRSRINKITQKHKFFEKVFIKPKDIENCISKSTKLDSNKILNLSYFKIDDIVHVGNDIKQMFEFNNLDFVKNHDYLEKILTQQSIGLYINKKDIYNNTVNYKFIQNASKRLNKYIKRPVLYIFSTAKLKQEPKVDIEYKILQLSDWREEFYFLTCCNHNIVLSSQDSYSEGLWGAILTKKPYSLTVYDKKIQTSIRIPNWIPV